MRVAIASGKGGTGKTTVSVNLASYLSSELHTKVTLCDLDVEEPNGSLFLDIQTPNTQKVYKQIPSWLQESCSLCGQCAKICAFNAIVALPSEILLFPELCHSCHACSELCPQDALPMQDSPIGVISTHKDDLLTFIEGRLDIGQEMAVPLIAQSIDYAKTQTDKDELSIFDAPPGTSCPVIEVAKNSDLVLLVTEPTPFGLNDLKLAVETVRILKKPFGIIINRTMGEDSLVHQYCLDEDIPIAASIDHDKALAKQYAHGELLYPHSKALRENLHSIYDFIQEYA